MSADRDLTGHRRYVDPTSLTPGTVLRSWNSPDPVRVRLECRGKTPAGRPGWWTAGPTISTPDDVDPPGESRLFVADDTIDAWDVVEEPSKAARWSVVETQIDTIRRLAANRVEITYMSRAEGPGIYRFDHGNQITTGGWDEALAEARGWLKSPEPAPSDDEAWGAMTAFRVAAQEGPLQMSEIAEALKQADVLVRWAEARLGGQ